jgi:hypothetical protein
MRCEAFRFLLIAAMCAGISAAPLHSQPWRPGACSTSVTKNWSSFEKAVRSAPPSSVIYAPVPYPQSAADVLQDFHYAYSHLRLGTTESDLPENERAFYNRFMAGKLSARIETVQNWTPTRCAPEGQHDFYFLLLLSDTDSGVELGRFALRQTGLFSQFSPEPPPGAAAANRHRFARPLATRASLTKSIQLRYGLALHNAQFVDVYGSTHCRPLVPCTAFESGANNYVLSVDDLFEITATSRRALGMDRPTLSAVEQTLASDEAVISLAAEAWVIGHRVAPVN